MAEFSGGHADDYLSGTDSDDRIKGLGGNDVLVGNLGDDNLQGGAGYDLLIGDVVNDYFSTGNDTLSGGDGNDLLSGGGGDDILRGGDGDDILFGGTVAYASFYGTNFYTQLFTGGAGKDTFDGGAGIDQAYLAYDNNAGAITVDLSDPNVVSQISEAGVAIGSITAVESIVFYGSAGDDQVIGGVGDDVLIGNPGNDHLSGGTGDDWLEGGSGDDVLDGGEGFDRIDTRYSGAYLDISFDLSRPNRAQETGFGRETLISIENLYVSNASGGSITLAGEAGANILSATGAGDITINGADGDDYAVGNVTNGGAVTVSVSGGNGADQVSANVQAGDNTRVSLSGGTGDDRVYGTVNAGENTMFSLSGGAGADYISGTVLAGGHTTLSLSGGTGDDMIYASGSSRFSDVARIVGGSGDDQITISGIGTAIVDAGAGSDTVTIDQRGGNYLISLGAGSDVLTLDYPAATETATTIRVRDFATGAAGDRLSLSGLIQGGGLTGLASGANPFLDGHLRFVQAGSRTILQVDRDGGGDNWSKLMTFDNTDATAFTPENVSGYALVAGITQTGADASEHIGGTAGDDVLIGAGGNDRLNGSVGTDILYGDLADRTAGPAGNDVLRGDTGNDFLIGGRGNDRLYGGAGNDLIFGGLGSVTRFDSLGSFSYRYVYTIDAGIDRIDGGDGFDRAFLSYIRDGGITFDGSDPAALTQVHFGDAVIGSVVGIEQFVIRTDAGMGDDRITTGAGNDDIYTGAGDDVIFGGSGYDVITGGIGNDTIDGGADDDQAVYVARSSALIVDLSQQGIGQDTGENGIDTLTSVEGLYGETYGQAVTLIGDNGSNNLVAYRLADTGELADVTLVGGDGQDSLDVETDSFVGDRETTVSLDGGTGDDYISVYYYGTTPPSALESLQVIGGDGVDRITLSGAGTATIDAGAGNDQVRIDMPALATLVSLGSGVDTLTIAANATNQIARDALHITDFATGPGGDIASLGEWLNSGVLTGYNPGTNPFASGYLTLHQAGDRTQLLVDRDGGGDDFKLLLTFEHTRAAAFDAGNFAGFAPSANTAAVFEAAVSQPAAIDLPHLDGSLHAPVDLPFLAVAWV